MTCENCGKLVQGAPCDDAMDCFCQRCPVCDELILDGAPIGSPCQECDQPEPCPMGCGRTTEDVAGGPCNACWDKAPAT